MPKPFFKEPQLPLPVVSVNVSLSGTPPAQVHTPGSDVLVVVVVVDTVVVVGAVLVVVLVLLVVEVGVSGVVVVVVDGHGRLGGRGRQTSMTESMSTAGVALRATAITRSGCRLAWSGPNGPRCASTAMGTNVSPQDDFVRSSPCASAANRDGTTWRRARPSVGGVQTGMSGSFWFRQRRTFHSQKPLPHTPSWSHGSPSTHSTRGGCVLGIAVMPSNSE